MNRGKPVAGPILPSMSEAVPGKSVSSVERILSLVALLSESSRPLTLETIVNEMSFYYGPMSEATRTNFERDKAVLRQLGMPITTQVLAGADAGKTAYSIDRSGYRRVNLDLTESEMSALQEAAAMVQIGTSWGASAVRWLGGEISEGGTRVRARVAADTPVLPELNRAVAERRAIRFDYHGRNRTVHPRGLLARNGFWYLVALDTGRNEQVAFRVDRIEGDVVAGDPGSFEIPEDFRLAEALPRDAKYFPGGTAETAVVRVDARLAPTVTREMGEEALVAVLPDGAIEVEVPCGNRTAFYSWLFAMVDRAEVVRPARLRVEVMSELEKLAES